MAKANVINFIDTLVSIPIYRLTDVFWELFFFTLQIICGLLGILFALTLILAPLLLARMALGKIINRMLPGRKYL